MSNAPVEHTSRTPKTRPRYRSATVRCSSELTLAMVTRTGLGTLTNVIHPYPTQAEVIKAAAGAYTRTRLTPFVAALFRRWFSWTR